MTSKESYYQSVGFYSLPFSAVPLATVTLLECLGSFLPFLFGSVGFCFAVSALCKGKWMAKLCGLISLLMFTHIALVLAYNHLF
ncbi:MAG: hypothetical protein ABI042_09675 [Verrucomicrobiota bacterium]